MTTTIMNNNLHLKQGALLRIIDLFDAFLVHDIRGSSRVKTGMLHSSASPSA